MTNRNLNQHGPEITGLGVMIGRCFLDRQHGGSDSILRMLVVLFPGTQFSFRYTNDEQIDLSHQTPQRRKCTREENKLALYCYFRINPTKRGYRKIMIEIWAESGIFKATNQRLADQVRKLTKNSWFSDLEILEIHQEI